MKASALKKSLIAMIDSKIPVFVWGSPGVGKSSLIKQIANDKSMEFIDLRLSLLDPTDLRGIPFFDAANKSQPSWYHSALHSAKRTRSPNLELHGAHPLKLLPFV